MARLGSRCPRYVAWSYCCFRRIMKTFKQFQEEWSNKYKKSIDCSNPKGFHKRHIVPVVKKSLNEQPSYSKKTWATSKLQKTL